MGKKTSFKGKNKNVERKKKEKEKCLFEMTKGKRFFSNECESGFEQM